MPRLSIGEKGVEIAVGAAGTFVLGGPRLMTRADEYDPPDPEFTAIDSKHAVVHYPGGLELEIQIDDGTISYVLKGEPGDAYGLRFTMFLPIQFREGGQFSFGNETLRPFPRPIEKPIILKVAPSLGNR